MKYIRTKDRIYEYEEVKTRVFIQEGRYSREKILSEEESLKLFPYEIIKQANTIEELCDEFVIIRNGTIRVYPKIKPYLESEVEVDE